ncbi:TPA: DEAD/DEAH box helicase family protein [Legionella anisa]
MGQKQHLEAAITIGGAVYTVDLIFDGYDSVVDTTQNYTVNITSKLNSKVSRGKLFFDHDHTATVELTYDKDGDLRAVTKKGLAVDTKSFVPYAYQNEILAKFHDSLVAKKEQRLAVMATGSGKSIVMAGIAQAVGRTIMIVPDQTLVKQQIKETTDLLSAGIVQGVKVDAPRIFTLDSIKGKVDIDWDKLINQEKLEELKTQVDMSERAKLSTNWAFLVDKKVIDWDKLDESDVEELKAYFAKVVAGTEPFDQIILQAEHPLFKIVASEIKDSMVLIDESHKHTFKPQDTEILVGIQKHNTVLALTATPTSELYDLFKGEPLDDLSLGAAIELGTIRPIKPELAYLKERDLVDQAVVHYFDDYYLEEGMMGYVDPVALKKQIIQAEIGIEDSVAQERAINQALELNRIRCQRNMGFSDDKVTREKLAGIYQKIANGDVPTIEKYQDEVAKLRQKSECDARLKLTQKFGAVDEVEFQKTVAKPVVNLKQDIDKEQQKDIQRAINSFALFLVFNEKQVDFAEKDRTHKLENYLAEHDQYVVKYKKEELPEPFATKFKKAEVKSREDLKEALVKSGVPISNLPVAQKEAITKLILDRAEALVTKIKGSESISDVITGVTPVDLVALKATENYSDAIDMSTKQSTIDEQIAQIEVGLRTHIIADQVIATGVSIRDILNVQIINTNSPVIESDINVINGILSGPQATGRCVRNKDTEARVEQYIDQRYEGKGLILTVHDVIDAKNSATKAREVLENREKQAKKEAAVVRLLKTELKGFDAFTLFQQCVPLHDRIEGLVKKLDVLDNLLRDKEKSVVTHQLTRSRTEKQFESRKESLEQDITSLARELEIIPGRKGKAPETRLPTEYARNASLYLMWVKITLKQATLNAATEEVRSTLEQIDHEIEKLEEAIKEIQVTYKEGSLELEKLRAQEERMILQIEEASKQFTSV